MWQPVDNYFAGWGGVVWGHRCHFKNRLLHHAFVTACGKQDLEFYPRLLDSSPRIRLLLFDAPSGGVFPTSNMGTFLASVFTTL